MEARTGRPRRARVPRLREQRRHPRRVEHSDAGRRDPEQAQPLAGERRPWRRRARRRGTGPSCGCTRAARSTTHEAARPRTPPAQDPFDVRPRDDERQERLELVHPRLLRVVGEERVERSEHRRRRAPADVRTPRARRRTRAARRRAPKTSESVWVARLAVAEEAHPDPEQHVVERRRPVLAQEVRDRRPVLVRDADRDPLVDPEAGVQLPRAREEREQRRGAATPTGTSHRDPTISSKRRSHPRRASTIATTEELRAVRAAPAARASRRARMAPSVVDDVDGVVPAVGAGDAEEERQPPPEAEPSFGRELAPEYERRSRPGRSRRRRAAPPRSRTP